MASTHSSESRGQLSGTQLLDHPAHHDHFAQPDRPLQADYFEEGARHKVPRQARAAGPVLGVTAMAAALGATTFSAAAAAAATPSAPPAAPAFSAPDLAAPDAGAQGPQDGAADPGLALFARIQQQADTQRTAEEEAARLDAAREAAAKRAAQAEAAALAAVAQATAEAEAAARSAQAPVLAVPGDAAPAAAGQGETVLPVARYTLSAHYGQSGSHWAHLHTGLDFAAATGTPVAAVAGGTVTSAGWSGSYGYRVIQTLPDGTELWYCHLASITVAAGQVAPGAELGKVGATGTVTGPHLHLEVRPGGAAPVDPLAWLGARGVTP